MKTNPSTAGAARIIRNVLRFKKIIPNIRPSCWTELPLHQNVLDAARAVIDRNTQRNPKSLFSERGHGEKIILFEAMDDHAEAMFAVEPSVL
jgi:DNA helicase-2/ATP-dependent DNA helicase PcrA